ncbi:MAG: hypothetical protein ACT4TC_22670 [Myxococcaceae bacterium]
MRADPAKRIVATLERWIPTEPSPEGPLKFDFDSYRAPLPARPEKAASIKEAVLRWLDEQL